MAGIDDTAGIDDIEGIDPSLNGGTELDRVGIFGMLILGILVMP